MSKPPAGAPTDQELEGLVTRAFDELPRAFRDRITNLGVVIEEEPPDGEPWLATYQGTPLTKQSNQLPWMWPSKITIYRGPLLRLYGHDATRLEQEVRRVVRHELAHYFGISDDRLVEIDRY